MYRRLIMVAPPVILLAAVYAVFLVRAYLRARSFPKCWRCGAAKVRRSLSSEFFDVAAAIFLLSPYRCSACRARFYAWRTPRNLYHEPTLTPFPRS